MTKSIQALTMICVLGLTATSYAGTALKLGADASVIKGATRATTQITALAYYRPAYSYDSTKSSKGCTFAEDQLAVNGPDKMVSIKAIVSNGQYSMSVPTKGIRGACTYVLDTVYMTYEDKKIMEPITLRTSANIDLENRILADVSSPDQVTPFASVNALECDFASADDLIICNVDGNLADPSYQISNTAQIYNFDVKDVPAPQY